MAEDQKVTAADASENTTPATSADGTESSEAGVETPDSQFDMDAFRRDLAGATQEIVSRAEFETVKRQAGQTKAMQREIADLRRELAERPSDAVRREEYDLLLEALADSLPADRQAVLNRSRAERGAESAVKQQFTEFEKRIFDRMGIKDEPDEKPGTLDPEVAAEAINRMWQTASEQVFEFAKRLDVEVTDADFAAAQAASGGRVDAAVEHVVKTLQARKAAGMGDTRETRVEERKAAAAGGAASSGPRDGSQGNFDLSTLSGLAKARRAGAITSEQFLEKYRSVNRDAGR